MATRPEPPDLKNWSTLSRRVRIAGVYELGGWATIGLALAIGVITLASAAVLLAVHLLSLVAVFSSRRSWWPPEPADVYDGLAAHGRLLIALGTGLLAVTLVLVTVGALHL